MTKSVVWPIVPIREAYIGLFDGPHATPPPASSGPVFLGIGNLTDDGHLDLSDIRHIDEKDFPAWTKRVTPQAGDIVFTYEATLNRYAMIPDGFRGCLGRRLALIRSNPATVDTRFLFYTFFSKEWRDTVAGNTISGATVERIPINRFPEFPVRMPSLPTQRQIASTLSAYDDLIENNTRRIAILEEMARRIFEEWFVHFRAPGCEGLPMVDSAIGPVPEGWEVKPIGDVFEVTGGGTPSKAEPSFWENGTINWFTPSDLTGARSHFLDASGDQITEIGLRKSSARLFAPYSVMMTSRATLGVFAINTTPAATNQGFITCLPNDEAPLHFLYFWLRENAAEFERHASGATFKEVTKGTFKKLPMCLPPSRLRRSFDETVGAMMQLILNLERENRNLRAQRDLLLPKLISGEIDVSRSAAALPEAAE